MPVGAVDSVGMGHFVDLVWKRKGRNDCGIPMGLKLEREVGCRKEVVKWDEGV